MAGKGASVYISARELESLESALGFLGALLEHSDDQPELIEARKGLARVLEKAGASQGTAQRRGTIKAALAVAKENA